MGFESKEIFNFVDALANCGRDTIDEFLTHNSRFDKIGKYAIAMSLIRCENPEPLMLGFKDKNWYKYLFTAMSNETDFDSFVKNNISFITFNYDRSLEQFLFTALRNLYVVSESEVYSMMKKLRIVHVHGQLGYMPWQNKDFRPYHNILDTDNLKKAAEGIITINEADEGIKGFVNARRLISEAQKVVFLGFGFHTVNIQRLNATRCLKGKYTLGTAKDISERRKQKILHDSHNDINIGNLRNMDVATFMNEHIDWIY